MTSQDGVQATSRHVAYGDEAAAVLDGLLDQPYGNWHVETVTETVQLRVTKKGGAQLHRAPKERAQQTGHDRSRRRLIADDDPLFAPATGADKRRQVEAFLRAMDPVVPTDVDQPVGLVDLGCGNAALTFAAYRYLTEHSGREARVVGVDLKIQSKEHNEEIAAGLGWSEQVRFVTSAIADAEVDMSPARLDLVVALHACDTATDEAIARAVRWAAPALLAAPCCHHDLASQLKGTSAPPPYAALVRHGIIRERFADVLTDSLRAQILRILGYRVEVMEFVGSEHTPRNTLIRAVRTGMPPAPQVVADYRALIDAWGVRPALAAMLEPELTVELERASPQ